MFWYVSIVVSLPTPPFSAWAAERERWIRWSLTMPSAWVKRAVVVVGRGPVVSQ